uniref:Uncharacterized protein TCIL3000_3_2340 n=1 Tax=Trypanosoma congolense (strain IL3000) TaxID=1068625 RepID=G0UK97_TRYCI|nr:unnamed protein product [Trypanosoma congolense IL3000]
MELACEANHAVAPPSTHISASSQQCEQTGHQTLPFVLGAPVQHASFFSLEFVEALIQHARCREEEQRAFTLPFQRDFEATKVLERVIQESQCVECWPKEHPKADPPTSRSSALSPSYLLRAGLMRALGFPETGTDEGSDIRAVLLDRGIVRSLRSVDKLGVEPVFYREAAQEQLKHIALCEWCEELIFFAVHRGFSGVQVQCMLLTAMHLLRSIADVPFNTLDDDAAVAEHFTGMLQELLGGQSRVVPCEAYRMQKTVEDVWREEKDAGFVSAIEAKLAKEKNKKQRQLLLEQLENAPTEKKLHRAVVKRKVSYEVPVGPYFTPPELAHILNFFCSTAVQHWRLFHATLLGSQPVEACDIHLAHDSVFPFCVPPLGDFLEDSTYEREQARREIMEECEKVLRDTFEEEFLEPIAEIERLRDQTMLLLKQKEKKELKDDMENALERSDYQRVSRAFSLRLKKLILRNEFEKEAEVTSPTEVLSGDEPSRGNRRGVGRRNFKSSPLRRSRVSSARGFGKSVTSAVAAVTEAPIADVFSLEEVETSVTRLEQATANLSKGKSRRGRK